MLFFKKILLLIVLTTFFSGIANASEITYKKSFLRVPLLSAKTSENRLKIIISEIENAIATINIDNIYKAKIMANELKEAIEEEHDDEVKIVNINALVLLYKKTYGSYILSKIESLYNGRDIFTDKVKTALENAKTAVADASKKYLLYCIGKSNKIADMPELEGIIKTEHDDEVKIAAINAIVSLYTRTYSPNVLSKIESLYNGRDIFTDKVKTTLENAKTAVADASKKYKIYEISTNL